MIGSVGALFSLLALLPGSMTCALGIQLASSCGELDKLELVGSFLMTVFGFGGALLVGSMVRESP